MSKKKSFSGSTMTLKDFHGGSIQSDLSLPSAPGVSARQPDRFGRSVGSSFVSGHDQYRMSRSGSAGGLRGGGGTRGFIDENAPFLPHSVHIGRNFEEDERKPFDAASARRRIPSSLDTDRRPRSGIESTHHQRQQNHMMFGKPDYTTGATPNFMSEGPHFPAPGLVVSSHNPTTYGDGSAKPNAWGVRKEPVNESQAPHTSMLSGPNTASRFAHASAIEKISSGRWQSKHEVFSQTPNSETLRFPEVYEQSIGSQDHNVGHGGKSKQLFNERAEGLEMRYDERDIDNNGHYRVNSVLLPDVKKRDTALGFGPNRTRLETNECSYGDLPVYRLDGSNGRSDSVQVKQQDRGFHGKLVPQLEERFDGLNVSQKGGNTSRLQGLQQEGKYTGQQLPENIERPKLKLFPRSQPLESSESQVLDSSKVQQYPADDTSNLEKVNEYEINANHQTMKLPGSRDGDNRPIERPRLNLKPRTQPLEQSTAIIERERKTIFGDALPREMVLKERGCDNLPDNHDMSQPDHRGDKNESIKMDTKTEIAVIPNHSERTESYIRVARDLDRKDNRTDRGKLESQRSSWKSDNRYNTKEGVKPVERRPELDSWRKPVFKEPKVDTLNPRNGKTASAFELTQIYSRSASETRSDNCLPKQSSLIDPNQIPFSRLLDNHREFKSRPSSRKINGY